jgi:hypothetical protein
MFLEPNVLIEGPATEVVFVTTLIVALIHPAVILFLGWPLLEMTLQMSLQMVRGPVLFAAAWMLAFETTVYFGGTSSTTPVLLFCAGHTGTILGSRGTNLCAL